MLLSIGMIVKNEEKHLERCMKALLPLKDKIEYEIVIVDTGSSDRTKEIAFKYTDKVYDFEWINDFAAARNYGLEKCTGKWFMFLDADEEIDDCQPLVDFLLSKESEKYNSASIKMKSFDDKTFVSYSMAVLSRIYRNKDIKFVGKIHETIPMKEPMFNLDCLVNHYGYINDMSKKFARNNEIIDGLLKDNPDDLRLLSYRADSYFADGEYSIVIDIYNRHKNDYLDPEADITSYIKVVQLAMQTYLNMNQIDEAKKIYKNVKNIFKNYEVMKLDCNYFFIYNWNKLDLDDEKLLDKDVLTYIEEYKKIYKKYHENKYNDVSTAMICPKFTSKNHYITAQYTLIKYYYRNNEKKKMYQVLDSLYKKDNKYIPLDFEFDRIKEYENYERVVSIYEKLKQCNREAEFLKTIKKHVNDSDLYDKLIDELGKSGESLHSPLKQYVSVRSNEYSDDDIQYIKNREELESEYADCLYYCMKKNINIDDFKWLNVPYKHETYISSQLLAHSDVASVVLNYIDEFENLPELRILGFYCKLIYNILSINNSLSNEEYLGLLNTLISWQLEYAYSLYKQELFNDENIVLLPVLIQYCYYLDKAITFNEKKEYKTSMSYIRLAMNTDEKLARGCKLLLPELEERPVNEFDAYARKVKDIIISLINSGKKNDALVAYQQYKKVNPQDTELDKYFMN